MGKLFEKFILKIVHRHVEENNPLNACQYGCGVYHSTTLQWMRLTGHVTLNFSNSVSTATVFLGIEKAFDTTWHTGLLYELSKFHISSSLVKLMSLFLSYRKFRVRI